MYPSLFIYLSAHLSVCFILSIYLSAHLSVCFILSIYLSAHLSVCFILSTYLSAHLSVCFILSIYLCPSICLCYLFISLSIYLFMLSIYFSLYTSIPVHRLVYFSYRYLSIIYQSLSVDLSVCRSTYLPTSLSLSQSIYLSGYIPIYPSISISISVSQCISLTRSFLPIITANFTILPPTCKAAWAGVKRNSTRRTAAGPRDLNSNFPCHFRLQIHKIESLPLDLVPEDRGGRGAGVGPHTPGLPPHPRQPQVLQRPPRRRFRSPSSRFLSRSSPRPRSLRGPRRRLQSSGNSKSRRNADGEVRYLRLRGALTGASCRKIAAGGGRGARDVGQVGEGRRCS